MSRHFTRPFHHVFDMLHPVLLHARTSFHNLIDISDPLMWWMAEELAAHASCGQRIASAPALAVIDLADGSYDLLSHALRACDLLSLASRAGNPLFLVSRARNLLSLD